eukprot:TRINITY_DN8901_c0_g1_i2.p1 TRINITY_DN8901_c0_g1~~TRINITY_DN8901_c0_g1_i2.p1  ORF type:complete len:1670 (-),score=455.62 TRINITY_DN8901_c0_g1_i2:276-5285(-)
MKLKFSNVHDVREDSESIGYSDTNTLTSSSNLIDDRTAYGHFQLTAFAPYAFLGRIGTNTWLQVFAALVEYVQWLSFAFSGPTSGIWEFTYKLEHFDDIRTFRAGRENYTVHASVFVVVFLYIAITFVLSQRLSKRIESGEERRDRGSVLLLHLWAMLYPVFYLPCLAGFTMMLMCDSTSSTMLVFPEQACYSAQNVVFMIMAIVILPLLLFRTGFSAALMYDVFPRKRAVLSITGSRHRVGEFIVRTVLVTMVLIFRFLPFGSDWLVYGLVLVGANAAILCHIIYKLPFHNRYVCCIYGAAYSVSFMAAMFHFVQAASGRGSLDSLIAFVVLVPFVAALGYLLCWLRFRFIAAKAAAALKGGVSAPRFREFEVEVASRFAYGSKDESVIKQAQAIYGVGLEQHGLSVEIRIAQAVFEVSHTPPSSDLQANLIRIRRLTSAWDHLYAIYCVDELRKCLLREQDGGDQEITYRLGRAARCQEQCKRGNRAFWRLVLRDQLSNLPTIVTHVAHAEKQAERIYSRVIGMFPNSVKVLRAYGEFLDEIKGEPELSQQVFASADRLEEELSQMNHERDAHEEDPLEDMVAADEKVDVPLSRIPSRSGSLLRQRSVTIASKEQGRASDGPTDAGGSVSRKQAHNSPDRSKSPAPFAHGGHRRGEQMRRAKFRKQIEHTKSAALKRLLLAVKAILLIMTIDIVVIFAVTRVEMVEYEARQSDAVDAASLATAVNLIAIHVRMAQKSAMGNRTADFLWHQNILRDTTQSWVESLDRVHKEGDTKVMADGFLLAEYPLVSFFEHSSPQFMSTNVGLWDLSGSFASAAFGVADSSLDLMRSADTNKQLRTVLDNHQTLRGALKKLQRRYEDQVFVESTRLSTTLIVLLPVSTVILAGLAGGIFWPTLQKIKAERETVLKLFSVIPKRTVQHICDRLSRRPDPEDAKDQEDLHQEIQAAADADMELDMSGVTSLIHNLVIRFALVLAAVFAIIVLMFSVGLYGSISTVGVAPQITNAIATETAIKAVEFYARELRSYDPYVFPNKSAVQKVLLQSVGDLRQVFQELKFGDDRASGLLMDRKDPEIDHYMLFAPCKFPNPDAVCRGLSMLLYRYLEEAAELVTYPAELLNFTTPKLNDLLFLSGTGAKPADPVTGSGQMSVFIDSIVAHLQSLSGTRRSELSGALIGLFSVGLPIVFVGYFVLQPVEKKLRKENKRTMKMLLMIPGDAIDRVEAIRDFLDSGDTEAAKRKVKEAVVGSAARNQRIVMTAVDAIVVIGPDKLIEFVNPAAERTFGYATDELLGQNVKILMGPDDASVHDSMVDRFLARAKSAHSLPMRGQRDVTGIHKDGSEFPLQVFLTTGQVNGRIFISALMQDVSVLRENEAALRREQAKSEKLLHSILPATIAEQLKEEGIEGSKNIMADKYREVSVLFADIVGFTELSSKVTAAELVFTLNQLFCTWDLLCDKHKVEKIKTIGDCYMAAAGVPERCLDHASRIIEFAIEMLDSLAEFNASQPTMNLNLRVGINVGPVVAGVLGVRKVCYDLWGDTVNVASRMESTGCVGRIQVSHAAYEALKHDYFFEERGRTHVKGKGEMITYLYKHRMYERTASGRTVRQATIELPPDSLLLSVTPAKPIARSPSTSSLAHSEPANHMSNSAEGWSLPEKTAAAAHPAVVRSEPG